MIELLLNQFGGRGGSSGGGGGGGGGGGSGSDSWHSPSLNKSLQNVEDKIRKDKVESYYILDENGNILDTNSDNAADHVNISAKAFILSRNNIFTHNHPHGYMFSKEDMEAFVKTNAREMRATTPDGRAYAIRRMGDRHKRGFRAAFENYVKSTTRQVVDKYWNYNKSREQNIHKISVEHTKIVNNWLKDNAKKYGYEFREEKKRR